jgi:hypothetical protein
MQFNIMATPPLSGSSRQPSMTRRGEAVIPPGEENPNNPDTASVPGSAPEAAVANAGATNNPFGIPTTADGVPLFTVEQLQLLQRQTLSQLSQQQQQQQQSATPLGSAKPFMVVTQVPVQAASNLLHSTSITGTSPPSQQQHQAPGSSPEPTAGAPGPYTQFGPTADFLQPTPLSLECERQNRQVAAPKQDQSPSSEAVDSANTSKLAAQLLQSHFQQLAQLPKNTESEQLLQSLLKAAQSPVVALPTQQQQPQPQLNMLGSGMIEPLHSSSSTSTNNDPIIDSALWKAFFDDDDDNQGILNKKPSATVVGGATTSSNRQLDRGDILSQTVGTCIVKASLSYSPSVLTLWPHRRRRQLYHRFSSSLLSLSQCLIQCPTLQWHRPKVQPRPALRPRPSVVRTMTF